MTDPIHPEGLYACDEARAHLGNAVIYHTHDGSQ
jgi:hypothetical protein